MMEPMPHYSWIWQDKGKLNPNDLASCPFPEFNKFATDFHETVYDPKTEEQLACYLISYELTIAMWRWIVPFIIVIWVGIKSGAIAGLIALPCGLLFGRFICRFDVTPRCRRVINAKPGQTVRDCIIERLNQLKTN